jgi:hypothetical protein
MNIIADLSQKALEDDYAGKFPNLTITEFAKI